MVARPVLFSIICVILLLVFCGCASLGGTKTLIFSDKTQATVPMAVPDFTSWKAVVLAQEEYPNGNGLSLRLATSPDERISVMALIGDQDNKMILLAFAVIDNSNPNAKPVYYEDLGFLKTGTATEIFTQVPEPHPVSAFRYHLMLTKI